MLIEAYTGSTVVSLYVCEVGGHVFDAHQILLKYIQ